MGVRAGRGVRDQPALSNAGASAWAEYQWRLGHHKARLRRLRPVLVGSAAATLLIGAALVLAHQSLGWPFVILGLAIAAQFALTPSDVTAWRTGAEGEERTAAFLSLYSPKAFGSCTTATSQVRKPTSTMWSLGRPGSRSSRRRTSAADSA